MVCFASLKCGFWTGRDLLTYLLTYAHNLISKPHSVPPYTPYTTELVVAGSNLRTSLRSYVTDRSGSKQYRTISAVRSVKSFRSDAGGLASLGRRGLSVRHRRTRFARPPIGVRRDRLSDVTLLDGHTQSNLRTSLRYS